MRAPGFLAVPECVLGWLPGPRLTPTEHLVLLRIAVRAGIPPEKGSNSKPNEGWCWESQPTMAEALGIKVDTVQSIMTRLEKMEYIIKRRYNEKGETLRNLYTKVHPRVIHEYEANKRLRIAKALAKQAAELERDKDCQIPVDEYGNLTLEYAEERAAETGLTALEVRDAYMARTATRTDGTVPEGMEEVLENAVQLGFMTRETLNRAIAATGER